MHFFKGVYSICINCIFNNPVFFFVFCFFKFERERRFLIQFSSRLLFSNGFKMIPSLCSLLIFSIYPGSLFIMRFSNSLYTGLKFFITVSFFYRSDSELEAKLQKKDEVIAEIAEEKKKDLQTKEKNFILHI